MFCISCLRFLEEDWLKLHVSDQQVIVALGYGSPDNNVWNEYQEYFEYVIRRLQLENPSNYQHAFGVLKDAPLNRISWCPYTLAIKIITIIVFILDNTIKLVHVKVKIVNYAFFISAFKFELQIQFCPITKLYIRKVLWSDIIHSS